MKGGGEQKRLNVLINFIGLAKEASPTLWQCPSLAPSLGGWQHNSHVLSSDLVPTLPVILLQSFYFPLLATLWVSIILPSTTWEVAALGDWSVLGLLLGPISLPPLSAHSYIYIYEFHKWIICNPSTKHPVVE